MGTALSRFNAGVACRGSVVLNREFLWYEPRVNAYFKGEFESYYTMEKDYYWPSMVSGVYQIVSSCISFAGTDTTSKYKRHLPLFPATGPLEFVPINISGP